MNLNPSDPIFTYTIKRKEQALYDVVHLGLPIRLHVAVEMAKGLLSAHVTYRENGQVYMVNGGPVCDEAFRQADELLAKYNESDKDEP